MAAKPHRSLVHAEDKEGSSAEGLGDVGLGAVPAEALAQSLLEDKIQGCEEPLGWAPFLLGLGLGLSRSLALPLRLALGLALGHCL
eukprot:10269597-Lingulodinium_polyedra.AAC.1